MSTRKDIADFLFNVFGNVIAHHLLKAVSLLATVLTPLARRAIDWLRASAWWKARARGEFGDVTIGLSGARIGAALGALAVVMTYFPHIAAVISG
ncbi:MAG: hypothetical protein ACREVO_00725 [Steroidobacteraceae bacterium]